MLRKGMFLADRYEIIEQIGTGGMSDVYKAKCHKLNRNVAIKVLKQEFSQDKNFVSKFRIEAQSAAGLTHPNVVSVYDVGDEDGIHYIVMELVEGITLKKYIEKKGRLSSKEAVSIAIQVAQGIEAAHSHHIVHRDIKPQNIIISKEGKVKVTDFGIARAASTQTINSAAMGSVHYISPEQARGGYSDEKSDIYSFGITLYEMLTGTVPFDGDSTVSVAVQHIQDSIQPPSSVAEGIPVSVDKIVVKCTQKKTERRYQEVSALIADLKRSLVTPDVDFVKMAPSYDVSDNDKDQYDAAGKTDNDDGLEFETENVEDFEDDDFDDEDLEDDFDEPYEVPSNKGRRKEERTPQKVEEYDDYDDYDDSLSDKVNAVMKWLGIGIAAIIVAITIFAVVQLAGAANSAAGKVENQTNETDTQPQSAVNTQDMVKVPKVIGYTEEEAKKQLEEQQLKCKVTRQPSNTVAEGYVITQSQKENTKLPKNSTVTISVSSGSSTTKMVNVVGRTEEEAVNAITSAGFAMPTVDYDYSDTVEQGLVIRQSPNANAQVEKGEKITIVVSRGKEAKMVKVPNVVNLTETAARQMLDAAGLNVVLSATQVMSDKIPYGHVAAQNYQEGKEVPEGTTIELTMSIGLGAPTITLPAVNQTTAPATNATNN